MISASIAKPRSRRSSERKSSVDIAFWPVMMSEIQLL